MKTMKALTIAGTVALFVLAGCKKEELAPNPAAASAGKGTMKVRMTDAPGDYAALHVQITKVEAQLDNGNWITLDNQAQQVSVLTLNNGVSTDLTAAVAVDAGTYAQLRITFGGTNTLALNAGANTTGLTFNAGGEIDLAWPGAHEVIIPVHEEIQAGATADILLDFNAAASIVHIGNEYVIQPVINEVENAQTGIRGELQAAGHAAVMISNGVVNLSTYADASGNFLAEGLAPGTYTLTVFPTPAEVLAGLPATYTIENVVVTEGDVTSIGSVNF